MVTTHCRAGKYLAKTGARGVFLLVTTPVQGIVRCADHRQGLLASKVCQRHFPGFCILGRHDSEQMSHSCKVATELGGNGTLERTDAVQMENTKVDRHQWLMLSQHA